MTIGVNDLVGKIEYGRFVESEVSGVHYKTDLHSPTLETTFSSESRNAEKVMRIVTEFCVMGTTSIGGHDYRVTFHIPEHPDDHVHGKIECLNVRRP